jgi:hypothetical protein
LWFEEPRPSYLGPELFDFERRRERRGRERRKEAME